MDNAPDRIYAMPSDDGWMAPYCGQAPHEGAAEYLLATPAREAAEDMLKALEGLAEAYVALCKLKGVDFHQQEGTRVNTARTIIARAKKGGS